MQLKIRERVLFVKCILFAIKYTNFDSWREWKKNLFLVKRDDEVDHWGGPGKLRREKKMSKSETLGIVQFQFVRYIKLSLFVTQNWRDIPTPSDEIKLFRVLSCDNNIFARNRKFLHCPAHLTRSTFTNTYKDK